FWIAVGMHVEGKRVRIKVLHKHTKEVPNYRFGMLLDTRVVICAFLLNYLKHKHTKEVPESATRKHALLSHCCGQSNKVHISENDSARFHQWVFMPFILSWLSIAYMNMNNLEVLLMHVNYGIMIVEILRMVNFVYIYGHFFEKKLFWMKNDRKAETADTTLWVDAQLTA
ncbi:hypothetical protein ACJX0J_009388, partial [Zea mays]